MEAKALDFRGSDAVINALEQIGINLCIANPGTTEMWFVKSLASRRNIKSVLALHETVCAGACDGYARMTRKPALCLLHMGPGLANALSNLHNAKRARSPIVVLVGDMATWHMNSDAPLCMDIEKIAASVSSSVTILDTISDLGSATSKACKATLDYTEDPLKSRISTIIVPHDLSWQQPLKTDKRSEEIDEELQPRITGTTNEFLETCIERMKGTARGKLAFLIGGIASLETDNAIIMIGKIVVKTNATLYCENSFARIDRGCGRPYVQRLPYFPQDAMRELKQYSMIVTFDCRLPVAQFGYENGPSDIITLKEEDVWQLDSGELTLDVIRYIYQRLEGDAVIPGQNCNGVFCFEKRPSLPEKGSLTPSSLCAIIAHYQPESAIFVDESITSGGQYWDVSKQCPPFTHLTLTGGAIGCGPALALGAALACPDRLIINLQADGSALYSMQALWTQAKQKLNIVTVICSNRTYAILKIEVGKQGIRGLHGQELSTLTDISDPCIDWVHLAQGMGINAIRVSTAQQFSQCFEKAIETSGPFLIEAVL